MSFILLNMALSPAAFGTITNCASEEGWIILGWIMERWDGVMWTGLVWLRIGTGGELL
jgi:hypothetical protein